MPQPHKSRIDAAPHPRALGPVPQNRALWASPAPSYQSSCCCCRCCCPGMPGMPGLGNMKSHALRGRVHALLNSSCIVQGLPESWVQRSTAAFLPPHLPQFRLYSRRANPWANSQTGANHKAKGGGGRRSKHQGLGSACCLLPAGLCSGGPAHSVH